ncbi:unnamed protein product [Caenorhabditis bovis]|uniref:Choline/carnitine acyltransferase domain-containing protein n=1 Tax=Caenorhabditis bovis TaxID=2654633 RepID=A0A8S1FES5_9PELO|nr:unnamed protein product [Caenorhabditis bovis]
MLRSRSFGLTTRQVSKNIQTRGKHSLTGDDYQYLHKSEIPSYHFQKSLRRLPIPKLQDSVNRFLASAKVVLRSDVYEKTEKSIREFEKNEGPALQSGLLEYDKNHKDTSYISEPWFDMYLRARVPVAVNYNPFMMYAPDPDPKFNHQLTRATNLAISYARIKRSLDENVLAPEVFHLNPKKSDTKLFRTVCKTLPPSLSWFGAVAFKAFPLDMSQYKSLFCGSRIPKKEKDVLYLDNTQKHFLAIYRGVPYAVRIQNEKGEILPAEEIQASLAHILNNGTEAPANSCVGSLTSLERDEWADARRELEDAGNIESLKLIDGAMFALCLDELKTEDHKRLVQSLLIGDEAKNRWFDKCFQTIIDANGQATINFEHSWGDGVAVLRLMEESYRDTNANHFVSPDDTPIAANPENVKEIKFNLTDSIKSKIEEAQKKHVLSNSDLDFATMEYSGLNRDLIKKTMLSPDSVMQLAIQMAFYSMYKEFVPTYESCSTAAFLKGRTECMRSATSATRAATLAILEEGKTDVRSLLTECSNIHGQLVKEASMGQGFDRHLLGLKITAQRQGKGLPEFFNDAGYNRMGHFVLSTSTLSTETIVFGGFGPVVKDGFGIGYNVVASKLGAVISSNKSQRDAAAFANALHKIEKMTDNGCPSTRAEMVEAARKFMLTPKVRETPFEEQRTFLLGKGVTEAEIAEARASIPPEQLQSQIQHGNGVQYLPAPPSQQNRIVSIAQSAVILGSISYAGYRFMRSFILPKFFDIPDPATEEIRQLQSQVNDLQNSIKFIMDTVSQTTQQLATQQAEITRALYSVSSRDADLSRVESGISTIKSLLLSQHNFAPIAAPAVSSIPAWQQSAIPTTSASITTNTTSESASGYATPPANFRDNEPSGISLMDELANVSIDENDHERKTPV